METVSEIRKLNNGRYLIVCESGLEFPLYLKELHSYGIAEGKELPEAFLEKITDETLQKRARSRALHLLEQMDRTEQQLRDKLAQQHYPPDIVDDALAYVKSYHYVDDLRYAKNYLESRAAVKSRRQLRQDLYRKGISKETVDAAEEEIEPPDEESQIRALLMKRHYDPANADPKERQRTIAFLARRGYDMNLIRHAMQESADEESFGD